MKRAPSITVLPFVNISQEKGQEYFSDGLAEELLNNLTRIEGSHVTGRASSFAFKGKNEDLRVVGQKLNAATILEGSVRKDGNRIRITAQLVTLRTDIISGPRPMIVNFMIFLQCRMKLLNRWQMR